ncbi:6-bladed beta-propeller [Algibacter pacificus]|uniref:6-bladed beta-propeller n=1 Tax=Algibacter pacificus TaxID=2599389 RepID=UPI0011CC0C4E|nr:6-bladed beta-propeller [Algibacter pacificus]
MKKKYIVSFLVLPLFFFNCNKPAKKNDLAKNVISIDNSFLKKTVLFSRLLDSITYIQLETNNTCLIGEIGKIITHKNRLYIHDRKTKTIFWFSKKGDYINKLKKIGKGPGEYLKISDFFIYNDIIHIYDANLRKIFQYSLNGEFLKDKHLGIDLIRYIIPTNGGYLCNNEFDDGELQRSKTGIWKINTNGKFEKQYLKFDKHLDILFGSSPMYSYKNEIRFLSHLNNSLYSFKNDSLKKLYTYKFQDLKTVNDYKKGRIKNKELGIGFYSIFETDDWLISTWPIDNSNTKIVYHSKKDDKIQVDNVFANDISGVTGNLVKTNFGNNKLIGIINSAEFIESKTYFLDNKKNKIDKLKDITYSDNPILQIFHFK